MSEVVIVSACRTAIGAFGGTLRDMHAATISSADEGRCRDGWCFSCHN